MKALIKQVKEDLEDLNLENKTLVVAVSGGPDSVALVHILSKLGLDLHIAHLNHGLRGEESDQDAKHVEDIAQSLLLPYTIEKRAIPQTGSLQQEARRIRYGFFKDICEKHSTDTVVLAQHGDDQLETVFMNFFRGAGLTGLSGIKRISRYHGLTLIRPLLKVRKEEILSYLKENQINYRIDSSNLKEKYLRNRFRLKILPWLENQLGPGFKEAILSNVEVLQQEEDFLVKEAQKVLNNLQKVEKGYDIYDIVIDSALGNYHRAIIARVIRNIIVNNYDIREFTSSHILDIIEVCTSEKPKTISLPNDIFFTRWSSNLAFYRGEKMPVRIDSIKIPVNYPVVVGDKTIMVREEKNNSPTHTINGDKLKLPLAIRSRKEGDRFKISQTGGTKKLKDYFIDLKIPKEQRGNVPILVDSDDNIICIIGYRVSADYYVNNDTCYKLYLYIHGNGGI